MARTSTATAAKATVTKNVGKKTTLKEIASRQAAAKQADQAPVAPQVKNGALANLDKIAQAPKPSISIGTLVSAIQTAAISYKYALQMELSVGLAVFADLGGTDREARRHLSKVYQQSGYDCEKMDGADYKTVQRRIGAAADLFDWLEKEKGEDTVKGWMENSAEMASIQAIAHQLEQYNLKGINSVLALVGKPVVLKREKSAPAEAPKAGQQEAQKGAEGAAGQEQGEDTSAPQGQPQKAPEGSEKPSAVQQALNETLEFNRRAEDIEGSVVISTEHLKIAIPPTVSKSELVELSMRLLEIVSTWEIGEELTEAIH